MLEGGRQRGRWSCHRGTEGNSGLVGNVVDAPS